MATFDSLSRYSMDASGQSATRGPIRHSRYSTYTTKEGDTLESIATKLLGSPLRYWELADMNPQIKFPLDLTVGTTLRIPA